MKTLPLLLVILCLLLASCAAPAEPDAPGLLGEATADWYADPAGKLFVEPEVVEIAQGESTQLEITVANQDYIYGVGYLWDGNQWNAITYDGMNEVVPGWYSTSASHLATLDLVSYPEGAYFVAAYACNLVNNAFDCNDNKWILKEFEVVEATAAPTDQQYDTFTIEAESGGISSMTNQGTYVQAEGESGSVTLSFTTQYSDTYYVWANVAASSFNPAASDSFHITLDGGSKDVYDFAENTPPAPTEFFWEQVSTRCGGEYNDHACDPLTFDSNAGTHTIVFEGREAQAKLDKIIVTNDPNYNPNDANDDQSVCGNNIVETGETCDDGNTLNDDGCSATCQEEDVEETYACNDGQDNDGDSLIDMQDPGCSSSTDNNEYNSQTTTTCTGDCTARSLEQYGITWNFDKEYEYGTFANGDYWVKGPITLSSIRVIPRSPNPDRPADGYNGFAITPDVGNNGDPQGVFKYADGNKYNYDASLQPDFPVYITGGNSVYSTISSNSDRPSGGKGSGTYAAAVLTVVDEVPPGRGKDVFRPAYVTPSEPYRYVSDLRLDRIPQLAPPGDAPSLNNFDYYDDYNRVQVIHRYGWTAGSMRPYKNSWPYPAGHVGDWGQIMLMLALDSYTMEEKMPHLIAMVQAGIDTYGAAKKGARWYTDGGVNGGRHGPIYFAGWLFDDNNMLSVSKTTTFAEFDQTFYATKNPPVPTDWDVNDDPNAGCYKKLPEKYAVNVPGLGKAYARYGKTAADGNADKATSFGEQDSCAGQWSSYWGLNANSWVGIACAARLYGYEDRIDDPAFFDHMDRYMDGDRGGSYSNRFNNAMWYKHCDPWR